MGYDGVRERDFGADVVRIAALVMLLWLHFYLRNGFYYREIEDGWGFAAVMFRPVFMCCVPLFMMLTGYLKCGRKWTPGYYRSLVPILVSYLLISLVHLVYKIAFLKEAHTAGEWLLQVFRFELANYSWYVGMYVGLFLLSPLVNVLWAACRGQREHLGVVATLAAVTFLPATVNGTVLGNLLPAYFQGLYYVTYYVIGCYLRTYRPRPRQWLCGATVLVCGAYVAFMNLRTRTESANYYTGYSTSYNGVIEGIMTTALFLLFYQCQSESIRVRQMAAGLSGVVFEIYLLSYLVDRSVYVLFYQKYPMSLYLPVGLAMTLAVLAGTYPMAWAVKWLTRRICGGRGK